MTKTLEMVFRGSNGKEIVFSLASPKADLSMTQVRTVMQDMVARNIFSVKGVELKEALSARIRSRDAVDLA